MVWRTAPSCSSTLGSSTGDQEGGVQSWKGKSMRFIDSPLKAIHPYAKVLAMFAFDSYSQSKRSPRPLSRHRPCKTPFPIGTSFNKPWPNYHGSIRFWSNPIGTPVSNGPFFVGTVDAHKQKCEAGPFPSLYTAGWVLIKEKNEVQNEVQNEVKTRYGKSPASTHMDFGPQAANLPFLGSLVAKQWQFAESQHTAMAV